MNVDLLPIINEENKKIDFNGKLTFNESDVTITADVCGSVVNFAGRLEVTGTIDSAINAVCSRCLEPVIVPLHLEINEVVGENEVELDGTILNIDNIVYGEISVNLPIRYLCSENCKGLCSKCGANLNKSQCNCSDFIIDSRLEKLKDLLK